MFSTAKFLKALAALAVLATGVLASQAQAATCGVSGSATANQAVYDPFNPAGLATTTVTLTMTRTNPPGGGKTGIVNFYLKSTSAAADGSIITPISGSGDVNFEGFNNNIFYNFTETPPTLQPTATTHPSSVNRFFRVDFTGNNNASDTFSVTFTVQLPANLNLDASTNLPFTAFYSCTTSGGGQPTDQIGSQANAVVFPVTVLSALRTYYAGTALDFGDITNVPAVPVTPVRTDPVNHIVVQSSGAYSVTLSSANAYKLKKPGAVTVNDEVRYSLKFLGDTVSNLTHATPGQTAITHTCMKTGGASVPESLPIQATLIDGGDGKNPSAFYSDILTVTVTPLAYNTVTSDDCGGYTVP